MLIQKAIYALTGYDGTDGKPRFEMIPDGCCGGYMKRIITPEEQRDIWARNCLWVEGSLAGLAVTFLPPVIERLGPRYLDSEKNIVIDRIFFMLMCGAAVNVGQAMGNILNGSRFRYIVEGASAGMLLGGTIGMLMGEKIQGVISGAAVGTGYAVMSKAVTTITDFFIIHAAYLDA